MEKYEGGFFKEEDSEQNEEKIKKVEDDGILLPISNTCIHCNNAIIDKEVQQVFNILICKECKFEKLELITKTTAVKEYLLTNSDIKNLNSLKRPNPHKGTWHEMNLYLKSDVEILACEKWGSLDNIDKAIIDRKIKLKNRKIKKFKSQVKTLKRKTIFDDKYIKNDLHKHVFVGEGKIRRCHCGLEVEQEEI